ncbi:arylamine N-acetyltransferase [Salsuginibacillus halophilus]|uniref:Arylamine N-acetyltransferase n=1 Tax=Salsuginibacillus halophilus TaxID=517424 RepID=A0A2P8HG74_9BACI|nr:arylamine N-acetyltransferase [Salsuginibacillus halophilus]PSL45194.1 arylamine N-acetyltransferase [Salsuginibacillus halophilus]
MQSWVQTYLHHLQQTLQQPSRTYLRQLMRAHLAVFPFENFHKLTRAPHEQPDELLGDPETFLQAHETAHAGGTCFSLNMNFGRLLEALNFSVGWISPGGWHTALIVTDPENPRVLWYVDVGTGAPMFQPVSFTGRRTDVPSFAGEKVFFLPTGELGSYAYIRAQEGKLLERKWTFSVYDTKQQAELMPAARASFHPEATFLNELRCERKLPEQRKVLLLKDRWFIIRTSAGARLERELRSKEEGAAVIANEMKCEKLAPAYLQAVEHMAQNGVDIFPR